MAPVTTAWGFSRPCRSSRLSRACGPGGMKCWRVELCWWVSPAIHWPAGHPATQGSSAPPSYPDDPAPVELPERLTPARKMVEPPQDLPGFEERIQANAGFGRCPGVLRPKPSFESPTPDRSTDGLLQDLPGHEEGHRGCSGLGRFPGVPRPEPSPRSPTPAQSTIGLPKDLPGSEEECRGCSGFGQWQGAPRPKPSQRSPAPARDTGGLPHDHPGCTEDHRGYQG